MVRSGGEDGVTQASPASDIVGDSCDSCDASQSVSAGFVPRPPPLVFGPSEQLPESRGIYWQFNDDGLGTPVDFLEKVSSHLNIEYLLEFRESHVDKGFFCDLEYGIDFKAGALDSAMQLVFQPHLFSFANGVELVHRDLARRRDLGWYGVHSYVPLCPWQTLSIGTTDQIGRAHV